MSITAADYRRCAACREPSKQPSGFWYGVDEKTGKPTGGLIFTCKNRFCPISTKAMAAVQKTKRQEAAVAEENQKNGTDPKVFREIRHKCRLTLYQVSQMAGVSSSTVSAWETGHEPFPADQYLDICQRMREMIGRKEEGGTLTYYGSPQTPSWNNHDPEQLTPEITAQTNTGIYTAKFMLEEEYEGWIIVKISCSRCGAGEEFRYSSGNVLCAVYTKGWNSYGAALYCPECSATWNERNKDRPMAGPENTIGLIDEFYRRSKRRYRS